MTAPEVVLWSKLKSRQILNCKFRRQHSLDSYVMDFYCPDLRLAIEVDGEDHYSEAGIRRDRIRDAHLKKHGIHILRIANHDVMTNLDGVMECVTGTIMDLNKRSEQDS